MKNEDEIKDITKNRDGWLVTTSQGLQYFGSTKKEAIERYMKITNNGIALMQTRKLNGC